MLLEFCDSLTVKISVDPKVFGEPMTSIQQRLLVTTGDPAGVGPELALRTIDSADQLGIQIGIVGSAKLLQRVADGLGIAPPPTLSWDHFFNVDNNRLRETGQSVFVVDVPGLDADDVVPGEVNRETGRASLEYVNKAIDAVQSGLAEGIVTGPIHKEAWHAAGAKFPGHTELFAERAGAASHCMMLAAPEIRCALVTVHVGLAEVADLLSETDIVRTIHLAAEAVSLVVGRPARVTVLGLNPHAGEGGLFGRGEEERIIRPAIEKAKEAGFAVTGPLPPDTAFVPAMRAKTDVYVCMYHDQGLIPLKALAFDEAVNVTLGLGMVRTSVDHGTALDIAWKGVADTGSMRAAIKMAAELTRQPQSFNG